MKTKAISIYANVLSSVSIGLLGLWAVDAFGWLIGELIFLSMVFCYYIYRMENPDEF